MKCTTMKMTMHKKWCIQKLHYVDFLPFTLCHALWKLAKGGGWIQDQDTQKRFYFL